MKKALLLGCAAWLITSLANAQTWQWGKRGGGSLNGVNTTPDEAVVDMATDKNGNVYTIGTVEALGLPTVDGNSLTVYGRKDVVISSFNCNGTYRWSKVIGGNNDEYPIAIGTDTVGHVYATLYHTPFTNVFFSTDSTQPSSVIKLVSLIQYDTLGNFKWLRQPSPDTTTQIVNYPVSYDIAVENNGDVYWLTLLQPGLVSGQAWVVPTRQPYILKYNAQGTMIDHFPMQMQTADVIFHSIHLARTKTGGFIIGGAQNILQSTGTLTMGTNTVAHTTFLAKFNSQGQFVWVKENTLTTQQTRMWSRPKIDAQNNIYYSGSCTKGDVFTGYTFANSYSANNTSSIPFIGKTDSNGNNLWVQVAGGNSASIRNFLALKGSAELWLSGTANSAHWDATHFIQSPPNSGYPVYVARFNSSGTILSLDSLLGASGGLNYANCNAVDKNGNLLVGGEFSLTLNVNSSTTLTNVGGASDFFIAKFGYPCNCTSQPTSNFASSITTGKTVQFTYSGTTTSIDSVVWTWGDGQKQKVTTGYTTPLTHTYAAAGTYNACANVYGSCGTASFCKSTTITGAGAVNTLAALGNVSVYPNPAATFFTIEGAQGASATLSNSIGQRAMQFSVNSDKLVVDISALHVGIYILQLTDAKGNRGVVSIVKQ